MRSRLLQIRASRRILSGSIDLNSNAYQKVAVQDHQCAAMLARPHWRNTKGRLQTPRRPFPNILRKNPCLSAFSLTRSATYQPHQKDREAETPSLPFLRADSDQFAQLL